MTNTTPEVAQENRGSTDLIEYTLSITVPHPPFGARRLLFAWNRVCYRWVHRKAAHEISGTVYVASFLSSNEYCQRYCSATTLVRRSENETARNRRMLFFSIPQRDTWLPWMSHVAPIRGLISKESRLCRAPFTMRAAW